MSESPRLSLLEAVQAYLRVSSDSDSEESLSPVTKAPANSPASPTTPFSGLDQDDSGLPIMTTTQEAFKDAFIANMRDAAFPEGSEPQLVSTVSGGPKKKLLDNMKAALADPNLRVTTRHRFIELTNSAIYLDNTLFRPDVEFLSPSATAEGQEILGGMLRYLGLIHNMLFELLEDAGHVDYMLGLLLEEEVTPETRYKRMVCVIQAYLKKPRHLEQKLLSLYQDFFEGWVYAKFQRERNAQVLAEERGGMDRLTLTRSMCEVWDTLTSCIDKYALYRAALVKIRDERFAQILAQVQVSSGPRIGEWFGELP